MTATDTSTRPSGALGFYLAAVLGLAVSLDTSWRFFGERLDITGAERIVMFTVLEVALVACGLAMRANVQRYGTPGSPRMLAWALLTLSGWIAWDLSGPVQGLARVGLGPLLALVMLHAALGIEIKARSGQFNGTLARIGREVRERALSRLGLANDERDAMTRTRERHARRAARLAVANRTPARVTRLARALRMAQVGTDDRARSLMLAELAVLRHAGSLGSLDLPAPWDATAPATATGQRDRVAAIDDRATGHTGEQATATATGPGPQPPEPAALTGRDDDTVTMPVTRDDRTDRPAATGADRVPTAPATATGHHPVNGDRAEPAPSSVEHRRAVKSAASTSDAVAYAVSVTGCDRPAEVARWLTATGRETSPEAVRSALRRSRKPRVNGQAVA